MIETKPKVKNATVDSCFELADDSLLFQRSFVYQQHFRSPGPLPLIHFREYKPLLFNHINQFTDQEVIDNYSRNVRD